MPFFLWLIRYDFLQSGPDERRIPGNTITVQEDMPYKGLTVFGSAFLSKFECSQMPHPVSYQQYGNIPQQINLHYTVAGIEPFF